MLKIRLKRIGRRKLPIYRIVVVKSLKSRDSKSLVDLGYYDSLKKSMKINRKRLINYIQKGAYPTPIIHYLLLKICN
jgi:small subunit ribosomal protein S16